MSVLLVETVFAFPVSILVRKPSEIKQFPHFLRSDEEPEKNHSRMPYLKTRQPEWYP